MQLDITLMSKIRHLLGEYLTGDDVVFNLIRDFKTIVYDKLKDVYLAGQTSIKFFLKTQMPCLSASF